MTDTQEAPERIWADEKFWPNVDKQEDCWIWTGTTLGKGYGSIQPDPSKRRTGAHRFSWALHNGRWPNKGKVIMHSCDQPLCVNPLHLTEGTQSENLKDCVEKGRHVPFRPEKKSHCKNGHELSGTNLEFTISRGLKVRRCVTCKKIAYQKWVSKNDKK